MLLIGRNEFSTWAAMWSDIPWGYMLISVITSAPAAARSAPLTPLNRINKLDSRAKRHFRQFFSVSDTPPRPQHLADWISRPLDLNISQLIWINYWIEQWPSCAVRMQMTVDSLGDWSEFVEMNSSQSDERTFENDAICCWSNGTFFLLKIVKIEKTAGVRCWAASSLFL